MSQIYTRIRDNIKKSMKEKNGETTTLRSIDSEIQLKALNSRIEVTDDIVLDVITKGIKQRQDSIEAFTQGKRHDLIKKEKNEIEIIKRYLPKQLSNDEIESLVTSAIITLDAQSVKDMGKVMGFVVKQTKGKADNGEIGKIVKHKLTN